MAIEAEVISAWGQDAATYVAQVAIAYPGISEEDITGQSSESIVPEPNLCVFRIRCEPATFDLMAVDSNFQVLDWREVE